MKSCFQTLLSNVAFNCNLRPCNKDFFQVQKCDQAVMGGFRPDIGVVMCHNNIMCRTDMVGSNAAR